MAANTGTNIFPTIQTPLDEDEPKFVISDLVGVESLSQPYSFELTLTSLDEEVVFEDLVAQSVTVSIPLAADNTRYFNGVIADLSQSWSSGSGSEGDYRTEYKATLVPKLWLCSRVQNSRVFQSMKVPDIVQEVVAESGVDSVRLELRSGDYVERDFCVQYRETDLDFISRLLEDEGIYYYFEQTEDDHILVLADGSVAHTEVSPDGNIESLQLRRELRSTRFEHRDFDFSEPNLDLSAGLDSGMSPASGEVYDYPGGEREQSGGAVKIARDRLERYNRLRLEEEEARVVQIRGTGDRRSFSPGYVFNFVQVNGRADMADKDFLLLHVEHQMAQGEGGLTYDNHFRCLDSETQYRPPRITRKPTVEGPQTAIVVGPAGEEKAHTDGHGRVKVKFHWDRDAAGDDTSSCWIRVSQAWAGSGWGSISIPHVGHEVIVDFLEGNPDRPMVTGRVYHETNRTPQESEDGGDANKFKSINRDHFGNEIVLDATAGNEHIRLYSPHHKSLLTIGKSYSHFTDSNTNSYTYGNKSSIMIGNSLTASRGSKLSAHLGVDATFKAFGSISASFGYKGDLTIGPSFSHQTGTKFQTAGSNAVNFAKGHNLIAATELVNLLGGTTAGGTMSCLEMDASNFVASIGPNANHPQTTWKNWAARGAMVAGVLGGIAASIYAAAERHDLGARTGSADQYGEEQSATITNWENLIQGAAAVLVMVAAKWANASMQPQTHMDGDHAKAVLFLTKDGDAALYGTRNVRIGATTQMTNENPADDHSHIGLDKDNNVLIASKDSAKDKSRIKMTPEDFKAKGGATMLLEAVTGDLTLKAGGNVIVNATGTAKINRNLVISA